MPPEPISTDLDLQIYVHPAAVVSVADVLREDEFEEQEFLWITRARFSAAPEIPFAEFRYDYGRYKPPGSPQFVDVDPLDLVGKFVRVVIPATVDGDRERRWYGKFATRSVVFHGTGDNADTPTGTQTFRAFGVLWMLDMEPVLKGHVSIGEAEPLKIDMGIPFNTDKRGSFPARGNRSGGVFDSLAVPGQSHYVFNQQPRGPLPWSAYQAVQYLLERLVPTDAEDVATVQWALAAGTDAGLLSWYDIAVETHGRTVKAILDELIPRHRGVGYRAEFNPETALCEIHVFSFADADITLPSGAVLKANSEQRTLDFDQAYDVEVQVNDVETGRFHRVVVEGEKQTTTFTAPLFYSVGDLFEADWTDDEETAYAAGASGESWYAALDQAQQQAANQMARSSDKLAHVYTRFRLDATSVLRRNRPTIRAWAGQNQSGTVKFYWLAPDIDAETFDPEAAAMLTDAEDYAGLPFWRDGARFLRQLPLYDRYNYSGTKIDDGEDAWNVGAGDLMSGTDQPDFLPPFAFARVTDGASENDKRYALLHRLHETVTDPSSGRQWSVGLQVSTSDPSITLACRPNQLLAKSAWAALSPAPAETSQDHEPEYNGGLDPEKIFVTACLELPRHVRAEESISAAPPGVPESVLRIEATDCRVDWVCPYTVVAIKSGQMEKTTTGGFVRDDRDRLKDIARAAAEWYGRTRQTLRLSFKTLRNLFEVGWLITDFGSLQKEQVNTVITAIDLEFGEGNQPGRTTIETSYAALDIR